MAESSSNAEVAPRLGSTCIFMNMAETIEELLDVVDPATGESVLSPTEAADILEWRDTKGLTFKKGELRQLANLSAERLEYVLPYIDYTHLWDTQEECDVTLQMRFIRRAYVEAARVPPLEWRKLWGIDDAEEFHSLVVIAHGDSCSFSVLPGTAASPHVRIAQLAIPCATKLWVYEVPEHVNVDVLFTLLHTAMVHCRTRATKDKHEFLEALCVLVVESSYRRVARTINQCISVVEERAEMDEIAPQFVLAVDGDYDDEEEEEE